MKRLFRLGITGKKIYRYDDGIETSGPDETYNVVGEYPFDMFGKEVFDDIDFKITSITHKPWQGYELVALVLEGSRNPKWKKMGLIMNPKMKYWNSEMQIKFSEMWLDIDTPPCSSELASQLFSIGYLLGKKSEEDKTLIRDIEENM